VDPRDRRGGGWALALGVGFTIAIALPGAAMFLRWDPMPLRVEYRPFAPQPQAPRTLPALLGYPRRFDAFFSDRFGLRGALIRWHHRVLMGWLGVSPIPQVVVGSGGWLFLGHGTDAGPEERPFTAGELAQWTAALQADHDWLAARGIRFLVAVVPPTRRVYPEYFPRRLRGLRDVSRAAQLEAALATQGKVAYLDLTPALRQAKETMQVFRRTDTHWTDAGAYVGYREILMRLRAWFPELEPVPLAALREERIVSRGGSLARMLTMSDELPEELVALRPPAAIGQDRRRFIGGTAGPRGNVHTPVLIARPDSKGRRALIFRDSFGQALIPFLSEHFSRVLYLWQRTLKREAIEREKPDVVILEMSERAMYHEAEWVEDALPDDAADPSIPGASK
jgi:hypothetical protein